MDLRRRPQHPHAKLLARDLLALAVRHTQPPTFHHRTTYKPVACAETLGVVVSRERKDRCLRFLVDDGTGCVPCILWLNHYHPQQQRRFRRDMDEIDLELAAEAAEEQEGEVRLGALVRVRGRVTAYRGQVQVTVGDVARERDPNAEVLHWLDCVRLARHCYDKPPPPTTTAPPTTSSSEGRKRKGVEMEIA